MALSVGAGISQLANACAYWVAAKHAPIKDFGSMMTALGLATVIISVLDFGTNAYILRQMGSDANSAVQRFNSALSARFIVAVSAGTCWAALLVVVGAAVPSVSMYYAIWGPYIAIALISSTCAVPLRWMQRMLLFSAVATIEKVVMLGGVILGVRLGLGSNVLGPAMLTGSLASALASVITVRRLGSGFFRPCALSLREIAAMWRQSLGFGLMGIVSQLQRVDVPIVALVSGTEVAAYFSVPARLTGPLGAIPSSFSSVLYARLVSTHDPHERLRYLKMQAVVTCVIMGGVVVVLGIASNKLVMYTLGNRYLPTIGALRVYLVSIIFASINQLVGVYLQANRKEYLVSVAVGAGTVLSLVLVSIGAWRGGAVGASFGFLTLQIMLSSFFLAYIYFAAKGLEAETGENP